MKDLYLDALMDALMDGWINKQKDKFINWRERNVALW